DEMEGAYLYEALASVSNGEQAGVYSEMASAESRHAKHWAARLEEAGLPVPTYRPSRRARVIAWMARRFGARAVLPILQTFEMKAQAVALPDGPPGMDLDERTHSRVLRHLGGSATGATISQTEGWHRNAGTTLRAAVFGISDGLVSNLSLVSGVAGATTAGRVVLLAGVAGLLAGAFSMAAGEYVSVRDK